MLSLRFKRRQNDEAFTLLELLIVVIVIGLLAAIALPIFINQQRVAVDASVKSDVRNTITNVTSWQGLNRTATAENFNDYVAKQGKVAKSRDASVIGLRITAQGYTVCGYNPDGNIYKTAETAWGFSSASGKFAPVANGRCDGAVDSDGNDLSTTPVAAKWSTAATLPAGKEADTYSLPLVASGNPSPTYTLANNSTLPSGLSLAADGSISGTPTVDGDFTFSVAARNFKGSDTRQFTMHLESATVAPAWSTAAKLADGEKGVDYAASLSATGKPAPTYALASGETLPAGLSLAPSGALSGKPTVYGDFTFKVNATNTKGTVARSFTLRIDNVNTAPTWVTSNASDLTSGEVTYDYSQIFVASGYPTPTYEFKTDGTAPNQYAKYSLPDGLTLNKTTGELSGIPTTNNNYTFTIIAKNSKGSVERTFRLYIQTQYSCSPTVADSKVSVVRGAQITNFPTAYLSGRQYDKIAQAEAKIQFFNGNTSQRDTFDTQARIMKQFGDFYKTYAEQHKNDTVNGAYADALYNYEVANKGLAGNMRTYSDNYSAHWQAAPANTGAVLQLKVYNFNNGYSWTMYVGSDPTKFTAEWDYDVVVANYTAKNATVKADNAIMNINGNQTTGYFRTVTSTTDGTYKQYQDGCGQTQTQ